MPETFEIATVFNEKLQELVDCTNQKLADDLGDYRRKPIFKVPEEYIKIDERAYKPVCLSIGPYHYPMGEGKEYILKDVIQSFGHPLGDYYNKLITHERVFRDCYENIRPEISHKFLEILLFDSVFLLWGIDFFVNEVGDEFSIEEYKGPELCFGHYRDIFLVENQIPFDVLTKVYATAHREKQEQPFSLQLGKRLVKYFKIRMKIPMVAPESDTNPVHLLHLVHSSLVPVKERNNGSEDAEADAEAEMEAEEEAEEEEEVEQNKLSSRWRRAVEYHQSGVQFKILTSRPHTLLDVKFEDGVLWIPKFSVDEHTQDFFKNLVIFELLIRAKKVRKYVTAYIIFMSQLLSKPEDVTLLSQNKIIDHHLACDDHVSQLFQTLAKDLPIMEGSYYEKSFRMELEKHYSNRWNKWIAWLKQKHFDNPWLILALLAAIVLLVCTILQTFFSVFCYAKPQH
ncbi:hypothetical protein FCM35_KLT17337 [Carex littledalei]|uniref:Uncharacterized protein n=1 Tax=Carex littledalei TaxID=544730 RepID=A0A833R553_9POAL|nr:hypothetical protein FCM35_KLT17337 [Carex littledalei]